MSIKFADMNDNLTIEELLEEEEKKWKNMRFLEKFGVELDQFLQWPRGALPGHYVGNTKRKINPKVKKIENEAVDLR